MEMRQEVVTQEEIASHDVKAPNYYRSNNLRKKNKETGWKLDGANPKVREKQSIEATIAIVFWP